MRQRSPVFVLSVGSFTASVALGLALALGGCGGSVSEATDSGSGADTGSATDSARSDTGTAADAISSDVSAFDAGAGRCGGKAGIVCEAGMWCSYDLGTCHDPDQLGTCRKREALPCAAPNPDGSEAVCGCDGVTYGSQCVATSAGMSVDHLGSCEPPLPGKSCGGLGGGICASSEYCDYGGPPSLCGADDGTGTCKARPTSCIPADGIFCGCDGKTYESPCAAALAGTSLHNDGPCGK